jgi:hypothetical protein
MPNALRNAWAEFWNLVDGDSVRPFIMLYYVPLLAFGVLAVVLLPADFANVLAFLWIWVQIPATSSAMVGLWLRRGGTPVVDMSNLMLFRDWCGLVMQLGGHACMSVVLLAFELVAWDVARQVAATPGALAVLLWWLIVFAMFAISSYVIGCTLLSLQVARKIWRGIQLRRETRRVIG